MPSTTICNRFNRWSRRGFWLGMLAALAQANCIAESALIGSPYIKVSRDDQGEIRIASSENVPEG